MTDYLNTVLFGIYPYLAAAIFLVGSLLRYENDQFSWRSGSSEFLRKKHLLMGSNLFHAGIVMILLGHFAGLLTPPVVYHTFGLTAAMKQLLAIIVGGAAGTICLIGLALLIYRHAADARIRATSSRMDIFVLLLLAVQVLLGLASLPVSMSHMDGSQMLVLCEWAQRIVSMRGGAAQLIAGVHWIFKLHLFFGISLLAVLPFSRLVHIWSVPVGYLTRAYQIVRRR